MNSDETLPSDDSWMEEAALAEGALDAAFAAQDLEPPLEGRSEYFGMRRQSGDDPRPAAGQGHFAAGHRHERHALVRDAHVGRRREFQQGEISPALIEDGE